MCETERVGGEVWRTGVERGTEAEQQGEKKRQKQKSGEVEVWTVES